MESVSVRQENKPGTRHQRSDRKRRKGPMKKLGSNYDQEAENEHGDHTGKKPCSGPPLDEQEATRTSEVATEQNSWCMCNSFEIRPPVSLPFLTGWFLDGKILVRDLWSDELYLTDLDDGVTKEAFVDQLKGDVFYCAPLRNNKMVYCDSKTGLVHICTTAGNHIKTIGVAHRPSTHMYNVTVNNKGFIVFSVRDGKIFTIDPDNTASMTSISVNCKVENIAVTTSGYVVIKSGVSEFNVIRDGVIVHTISDQDWSWAHCLAHPRDDIIYISYSKELDGGNRRIKTLRPTGEVVKDEVFDLGGAINRFLRPSMMITPSCKIVVCDNGRLSVLEQKKDRGVSSSDGDCV